MNKAIVVEQLFNCSLGELWDAISNPERMRIWFFPDIPDFKALIGFKTSFPVISGERKFTHNWEIIECETNHLIKYHWSYSEYEGEAFVSFELIEKEGGTLLKITNEGLESFPDNIPEFRRESCRAGWEYFIKENLNEYIANLENSKK